MADEAAMTHPRTILVCTLGASWQVIPEIYGWLAPSVLDLYAHASRRDQLLTSAQHMRAPDEIWVCTTQGQQTQTSLDHLVEWWQRLGQPVLLRVWTAAGTDQLATEAECEHLRELIFRAVLAAWEVVGMDGQVVLSLAGGRKTMSADLQEAGNWFGATALVHVVGPEALPKVLRGGADAFLAPLSGLPAPIPDRPDAKSVVPADAVVPLVVGRATRSELIDLPMQGETIRSTRFPMAELAGKQQVSWPLPPEGASLVRELAQRQRASHQLLGNFLAQLAASEPHENWRSLYRLPARTIDGLRQRNLLPGDRDWLVSVPKADLHRHLGGCLSVAEQQVVARAIWSAARPSARDVAMRQVRTLLADHATWGWDWPTRLKRLDAPARALASSGLLLHASDQQLQLNLFTVTEPRVALKRASAHGFSAYERPGELSGSALLGEPASIQTYAQLIVAQARAEGLVYLELRGSPDKYRPDDPTAFLLELESALRDAGAQTRGFVESASLLRIGFLWILDRRRRTDIASSVARAVLARAQLPEFLLGLDLAGDEGTTAPEELAAHFLPAFADCLPLTIHAGEGESAQNIWQAAYHLHADRIGHGLSLADHPQLAQRFRDRGIALELCPSSNREVVGFYDPNVPASHDLPAYPLRGFIDAGLPLSLCTDNPGISQTTLADEFLVAARMTADGLNRWQALALIRQGFVHAFLPAAERDFLIKHIDQRTHALIGAEEAA